MISDRGIISKVGAIIGGLIRREISRLGVNRRGCTYGCNYQASTDSILLWCSILVFQNSSHILYLQNLKQLRDFNVQGVQAPLLILPT